MFFRQFDLAIEAVNLKSHVDLALREGKFNSNELILMLNSRKSISSLY